ncbi:MAG: hypothetical protein JNM66_05860 [Bryobacterales bacterium]|nr:hypothetical protein [Bryobacterales bacterium]
MSRLSCIVLVSVICWAGEPPAGLARKAAERETASEAARAQYLYQQRVLIEEIGPRGVKAGEFRETREVIFGADGRRSERVIGKPYSSLARLILTEEDFRDLREIQPLLLTKERLWLYSATYRGEETVQNTVCWVLEVKPRQILDGQRLFEGLLWISQADFSVVQSEGQAVPEILGTKKENLFPRFRTIRHRMPDGFWFPVLTVADDTLPFRNGPLRLRMRVAYSNYQKFGSDSVIRFDQPPPAEEKKP